MNEQALARYLADLQQSVRQALLRVVPSHPPEELYAPVRYVLEAEGKYLRPLLVLLGAGMFGVPVAEAMPAALAVEVFHTFTLVHDDIMDRAKTRRGRATVHEQWNASTAILVGDWLMGRSYSLLAELPRGDLRTILRTFDAMMHRLCEGQALDEAFEGREQVSLEEYLDMIARKTGALIETSLVLGGLVAEVPEEEVARLRQVGFHLGRAFQIQDDLLDLTATDASWGKPIGGDLLEGKKTYLLIRALEKAEGDDRTFFQKIARKEARPEMIDEARRRMEHLGILAEARAALETHYGHALETLHAFPENEAREGLRYLVQRMQSRVR